MSGRTFVDSNILIYAHDRDAAGKHDTARRVLRELWSERDGVLSPQVLQEFYVNVTRRIPRPLAREAARLVVNSYAVWCVDITADELSAALQIEDMSKIGFWDALIVASAVKSGSVRILSEDLDPGKAVAGIRIENPFAA